MTTEQASHQIGQRVMVAVDTSQISEYAFRFYMDTVHCQGNEVVLAHCTEPPYIGTGLGVAGYGFVSGTMYDEMIQQRREDVRRLQAHYVNLTKGNDVTYRLHLVEFGGNPGEALVRIAKNEKADLIVVGTRGSGKVRRTKLGSVSDYVVHHVHVPVLVCHCPRRRDPHHHKHH